MKALQNRSWQRLSVFVSVMLVVEFLDEFAYSVLEVARPLIRDTFALSYVEVGLITTLPVLVAILVEPIVGFFADGNRRLLITGGGLLFGAGLLIQGTAPTFIGFMLGATLQAPASGVFVNLAQASLMDDDPQRRENRMALWTFSGSVAVVTGPLLFSAMLLLGSSWRIVFVASGVVSILVALWMLRLPPSYALRSDVDTPEVTQAERLTAILSLLKRADIWRWLVLLELSNLMLDVLFSLMALYMVDVVGVSEAQAALAIVVWTGVGLIGDFLLIPLLERVRGLAYLRLSAIAEVVLYPAFLLVDNWYLKLVLLGMVGLFNAGWYAILQSKVYDELDEQSGAVLIVGNAAGIVTALLPVLLGLVAQVWSLEVAMWLLLLGPLGLLSGLPRTQSPESRSSS